MQADQGMEQTTVINVFQLSFTVSKNSITEGPLSYWKQSKLVILGDGSQRGFNHYLLQLPNESYQTAHSRLREEETVYSGGKAPKERKVSF